MKANQTFAACFVILLATCASAQEAVAPLILADSGATNYVILLPDNPSAVQRTAARELAEHLKLSTAAEFPIVSETEAGAAGRLVIGPSPLVDKLISDDDPKAFKYDEILIRRVGDDIVLTGHPQRGPLYAAYEFLEHEVGVRWWASDATTVPKHAKLTVGQIDRRHAPKLIYREAYYRDAFDPVFATRLRNNGSRPAIAPEYGGRHRFAIFVHSFNRLIPPEKYFDAHPEWFSEIKGKRQKERSQLCLTNDAMREELTRRAIEVLRANPDASFISISQNDWHGRCECEKCLAVEAEEGTASGPLLRFVNRVAEDIGREFPAVWVETLAYQYTRSAPKKVRPRKNVIVRLCTIECSFVEPLGAGEQNAPLRADIEAWSRIAPQLFVWDYVTDFHSYMQPHPNMRVLAPNIRFFVDHRTVGLFEQGDSTCTAGDFVRLRAWVLSKLMWDPTLDENKLTDEFLAGYYGRAAGPLRRYLDLIHDRADQSDIYLRCFVKDTSAWLDLATLNRATELFDQAEQAVKGDPTLEARVARARMTIDHVWLGRYKQLKMTSRVQDLPFRGPADPQKACEEFFAAADRFGVVSYREHTHYYPFAEYRASMTSRFGPPAPPPAECRELSDSDWIDVQDFDFTLGKAGVWGDRVEDRAASNGQAVRMPGNHREWALQHRLTDDFTADTDDPIQWRCYARVRCDAAESTEGLAMTLGIYDTRERQSVAYRRLNIADIAGTDYTTIDLGTHALRGGMYLWSAPPERKEVTAVYVDRFFLVRE